MPGTSRRSYSESHPWITFRIYLRRAGPEFWMLLGESRSKADHLAGSLLKPDVARRMHVVYLAKGVHATTAIEGNTLSEEDARRLLKGRLRVAPSQEYLARELRNIVDAFNEIAEDLIAGDSEDLDVDTIKALNRQVLAGLEIDDDVLPGEIREHSSTVGRYRAAPAQDCEYLLGRLCAWLNGPDFQPSSEEWRVPYALLKAAVSHLYVAWIHPFGDGNGRTARLLELRFLLAAGMPMPAAHLLSNHYNETRTEYYRQLDHASRSGGEIVPFLTYAMRGFVDGIRAQIDEVRAQQFADRWEQYIYESFGTARTPAKERQRELVLELSKRPEPVSRMNLPGLSEGLRDAYRGTQRMLSRDLNALRSMELVERVPAGWQPRRGVIQAFLPLRRGVSGQL